MRTPSSTWWRAASTTNGEPGAYPRAMPRLLTAPVSLRRTQARAHDPRDQGATVYSGAYRTLSMVVILCSMMTSRAYAPGSEHHPYPPRGSGVQATRAQPGGHLRVAVVEEELRAGFRGGDGAPLGLGELKVEGVDVLRRPTRPPSAGGVRQPHATRPSPVTPVRCTQGRSRLTEPGSPLATWTGRCGRGTALNAPTNTRATKGQVTAVRYLLGKTEDSRSLHLRAANAACKNAPEKAFPQVRTILPGDAGWGGWDSNPRPTDYESAALTG